MSSHTDIAESSGSFGGGTSNGTIPVEPGGPSASRESEEKHGGDIRTAAEDLMSSNSFRSACVVGDTESAANRFRSNVEIIEKPRQMIVLVATIAGASYLVGGGTYLQIWPFELVFYLRTCCEKEYSTSFEHVFELCLRDSI